MTVTAPHERGEEVTVTAPHERGEEVTVTSRITPVMLLTAPHKLAAYATDGSSQASSLCY